jgi:hypothetical protein
MIIDLVRDVRTFLAKHPDESFRESALAKKLSVDPHALALALDQLERDVVIVRCRIQRPGKPVDSEVRISTMGATTLAGATIYIGYSPMVTVAERARRARRGQERGALSLMESAQRKRDEHLRLRLGADYRPDARTVRCAVCRNWKSQNDFTGRQLSTAKHPTCESCVKPKRAKYQGRAFHRNLGI